MSGIHDWARLVAAEQDRAAGYATRCDDLEAELSRLRAGIQALADEWAGDGWLGLEFTRDDAAAALRDLLNPTPEGPADA